MNAYPIFRLALFLAAGIFCAETFRIDMGLLPVAVLLLLLLVLGRLLKETSYGGRWIFGAGVAIFMFWVGWVLTSHAWKTVAVDWYPERREYCGILQESPQEKKKDLPMPCFGWRKGCFGIFPEGQFVGVFKGGG